MAFIEILNDANTVLIGDDYSNGCVARRGTITLTPQETASMITTSMMRFSLALPGGAFPILALGLNDIPITHMFTEVSGSTFTWTLYFDKNYAGRVLDYYVFMIPSSVGSAGGILQMWNGDGLLTFDSNLQYMRVTAFLQLTTAVNETLAAGMVDGRVYALVCAQAPFNNRHLLNPPGGQVGAPYRFLDTSDTWCFTRSGANLVKSFKNIYTNQTQSDTSNQSQAGSAYGVMMVVDVTNY